MTYREVYKMVKKANAMPGASFIPASLRLAKFFIDRPNYGEGKLVLKRDSKDPADITLGTTIPDWFGYHPATDRFMDYMKNPATPINSIRFNGLS